MYSPIKNVRILVQLRSQAGCVGSRYDAVTSSRIAHFAAKYVAVKLKTLCKCNSDCIRKRLFSIGICAAHTAYFII